MTAEDVIGEDMREILAEPLPWHSLEGATVIVTGAGGMLASYMVQALVHAKAHVVAVVRQQKKAFAPGVTVITQDASEPVHWEGDAHYIIHAASQASPKYYGIDPVGTSAPNVFGTAHLLALARAKQTRALLFFSSGEVYGQVAQMPIGESDYGYLDPTQVRSCYAESKRMGEQLCVAHAQQHGVHAKIVRPFHTYGPGMALDDGRVFADFVADVLAGRDIVMKSDGSARRPYCYIADATRAFFTVLLKGADATAYNVGNPAAELSVLELAQLLAGMRPGLRVQQVARDGAYLPSPIARNCPDVRRLAALGWHPRHMPEQGFARTLRSFA